MIRSKVIRSVLVLTFSITGLIAISSSAKADPRYYPSGIQKNVPASNIEAGGWTLCYKDIYGSTLPSRAQLKNMCQGDYVLLAGGVTGSDSYLLAAAGPRSTVFADTSFSLNTLAMNTNFANGVYWYGNDAGSTGFSPDPYINQNAADTCWTALRSDCSPATDDGSARLSWHGSDLQQGGWRIGGLTWLNSSTDYVKAIYVSTAPEDAPPALNPLGNVLINATSNTVTCTSPQYSYYSGPAFPSPYSEAAKIWSFTYNLYFNGQVLDSVMSSSSTNSWNIKDLKSRFSLPTGTLLTCGVVATQGLASINIKSSDVLPNLNHVQNGSLLAAEFKDTHTNAKVNDVAEANLRKAVDKAFQDLSNLNGQSKTHLQFKDNWTAFRNAVNDAHQRYLVELSRLSLSDQSQIDAAQRAYRDALNGIAVII